jgi:penicillin G amidase
MAAESISASSSAAVAAPVRPRRRLWRALGLTLVALVGLVTGAALWARSRVAASLPLTQGEHVLAGLSAPVAIERDGHGVPTVRAATRADAARALGFLHAQERFFQMDLMRRKAAGELSELLGAAALDPDRKLRVHRFRAAAQESWKASTEQGRAVIEAYTAGVNAGLAALGEMPFEYLVLRTRPLPWKPEDTILVSLAMFLELHDDSGEQESARGLMRDLLPAPLYAFLSPAGTEWDAPIVGPAFEVPPIPGPEVFDLRREPPAAAQPLPRAAALERAEMRAALGSNNWAVDGKHSKTGAAIVADDMHLGISVPNTWYRASLAWTDSTGPHQVTGATLPGAPTLIVGSTGSVAWAFTNSQGDWNDLVVIEPDPADASRYLTPSGPQPFVKHQEALHVKGGADQTVEVQTTIWGPVIDTDHRGRKRALHWTAYDPGAVNLGLLDVETATGVDEAVARASLAGIPPQNFVCGDSSGRIAWTIIGRIPRRTGLSGREPESWADGSRRWDGWLASADYPKVVDPPSGRLWSANSRMVDGEMLARIGESGYDLGARQKQIRDALLGMEKAGISDMLQIQLDDRALFLARWRELLLRTLDPAAVQADARRAEFRRLVEGWGDHAATTSAGYRLVRAFRIHVAEEVLGAITARCKTADKRFDYPGQVWRFEGPLWALVSERPAHLLPVKHRTWEEQLLAAVDMTITEMLNQGGTLADRTWGERNLSRVRHPLSGAVPGLGRWLDMPAVALPGDSHMPRFQSPRAGASERMAVSPGREAEGYFHMPGGASGHPMSAHYGDGHMAWVKGEATPFLPGAAVQTLTLKP